MVFDFIKKNGSRILFLLQCVRRVEKGFGTCNAFFKERSETGRRVASGLEAAIEESKVFNGFFGIRT